MRSRHHDEGQKHFTRSYRKLSLGAVVDSTLKTGRDFPIKTYSPAGDGFLVALCVDKPRDCNQSPVKGSADVNVSQPSLTKSASLIIEPRIYPIGL